jgi:hypothetical protein
VSEWHPVDGPGSATGGAEMEGPGYSAEVWHAPEGWVAVVLRRGLASEAEAKQVAERAIAEAERGGWGTTMTTEHDHRVMERLKTLSSLWPQRWELF